MEKQELKKEENIVSYSRYDTKENIHEKLFIGKFILDQYAKEKGIEFVDYYVDIPEQTVESRPQFNRLMKNIELGKIDKVVVLGGIERLSRNHEEMMKILESVEIDIIEQIIKVTNFSNNLENAKFIRDLRDFLNECYRKELSKSIKQGIKLSKEKKKASK